MPRTASWGSHGKILVVDDDVAAAETLALLLEISGHDAHVAHDGRQALEAWNPHRHAVVFLDLDLPGTDGYEVARAIRDSQDFAAPLVVALTASDDHVVPLTKQSGFDSYLQKPAEASALFAQIGRVAHTPSRQVEA